MSIRLPSLLALMAVTAVASIGLAAAADPQPAPRHLLPQSLQVAQKETLEQLSALARRKGPVGIAASKVLVLYKQHTAREQEFILPPLTLLPYLAEGNVTPDMAWALAMTDRVKAEREEIFQEHTRLTDALNLLTEAARKARDNDAREFAENAAAESLNDLEVLQPTLMLIGDLLRAKLPAAH
jgi:hypothetical protein